MWCTHVYAGSLHLTRLSGEAQSGITGKSAAGAVFDSCRFLNAPQKESCVNALINQKSVAVI